MPGLTGFGINVTKKGINALDPVTAGLYETQQSMGSFPLYYVKDGVLTGKLDKNGKIIKDSSETWDFKESDKNKTYTKSLLQNLRIFAGRHGTNEKDNVEPVVTSYMKIPYNTRDK